MSFEELTPNRVLSGFKEGYGKANKIGKLGVAGVVAGAAIAGYKELDNMANGYSSDPMSAGLRVGMSAAALGLTGWGLSYSKKMATGIYTAYERSGKSVKNILEELWQGPKA